MSRIVLVALIAVIALAAADSDIIDEVKAMEPFTIRRSALACPVPIVGQSCPESNPLYYFRCCGELAKDCCFRLQDWVICVMILLAVLTVISIVINFIRCLFCY